MSNREENTDSKMSSSEKQAERWGWLKERERRKHRKTSASWSTVALSDCMPKRDMSWQVDHCFYV